jgi:threonylcarbamoyladenosine tRNA methylthiotransferase MtaB
MTDRMKPPGGPVPAPRVSFFTLGCRLNQHDTAAMRADLEAAGYVTARPGEPGEWAVVNTCTVTRRADQEARQLIRHVARAQPGARLLVTGCYAQRAPGEVRAMPGVFLVLGTAGRERIVEAIAACDAAGAPPGAGARGGEVAPARDRRPFHADAPVAFGRTRALLKVQDGCDSFCSFCVVPFVRGRSRSLPLADALEQARRLLGAGFREIVLTGADIGRYGGDLGDHGLLPRLVEGVLALAGHHRVRISSIEPDKVDPALLSLLGTEPRFCRHLHLPLQSGSPRVLRAMGRTYEPGDYLALCERAAARGPVGIGADVIVGFPGESPEDFEATVRLLEVAPITYLHVFRYSARPGTAAARLEAEAPSPATARQRSERLRELGGAKARAFHSSLVGTTLPVLPEPRGRGARWWGLADVYVPVLLDAAPAVSGIVEATVVGIGAEGTLRGRVVPPETAPPGSPASGSGVR